MSKVTIRPVERADYDAWNTLWTGYLEFYKSSVKPEIYTSTFGRFFENATYEPNCLVAVKDGKLIGLVHYFYHRHNWYLENVCYLQDLYADPAVRGTGVGRRLIEAVYAQADKDGAANVYWHTQNFNAEARKLYDRIANLTPFIKYSRN